MTTDGSVPGHDDGPLPGRCGGRKRQGGGRCTQPAGWGTDHVGAGACKLHGGSTANHQRAAQGVLALQALHRLGVNPREVEPAQALLELVYEAAGNVEFYRDLVSKLDAAPQLVASDEGAKPVHPLMDAVWGRTYHQSGIATGEAKRHIAVQLYDDERDRLAQYAAAVIKCGLAARQVELAELQAALVARVVMGLLDDPELGLSREQRTVGRTVAGRHLRALGQGSAA